ncbi:MAG: hypothetical protein Sv326_0316 [Candidatus Fermentimicrarchaeum limneticum]|uniref:Uncharacterized protein n=1 Tax=Fermentimicrarchaeum limneticum TaxID=2795018 RepID=A0A7D5XCD3_FERL1|nr:MAG: hypothetical protein Sv326_0316 [Candidatus Fermentimicrarchaeum limneticum]
MKLKLLLLIGIIVCGVTYAASQCSGEYYTAACSKCPFDLNGKMNETCYNTYQEKTKTCIATHHPILASNYNEGKCPEVDQCAATLEACKNSASSGTDQEDCENPQVGVCFSNADVCIAKAVEKCGGGLDISSILDLLGEFYPFAMILSIIMVGAVYAERRS